MGKLAVRYGLSNMFHPIMPLVSLLCILLCLMPDDFARQWGRWPGVKGLIVKTQSVQVVCDNL